MNHRGGWALVKSTWLSWMQHRGFFYLVALSWMMPLLIYLFVWSAAAGEGTVGGLTRGDLAAYYVVLILVHQVTFSSSNWTVGDAIRYGRMNLLLLRPLSPLYDALASEVDDLICIQTPPDLWAIGFWYENFRQLDDEEVVELLERSRREG